jgi:RimJ/RimL family protein N-acetyltransferase
LTVFEPIRTPRLLLRPVRPSDAEPLSRWRSDPGVAQYQNWLAPYPLDRAREMVGRMVAMDGPANDEWWMLTIADPDDTVAWGELVMHLSWAGRTAEIGYTLSPDVWGNGYASEAATALVEYLFATLGVTRVEGMLHPENPASAMVLERVGMRFEGHTRSSFWVGDQNSDDWLYGMTRTDWEAWRNRPRAQPDHVRLIEVTPDNQRAVRSLATHHSQERFVSPVVNSFADALFPGEYHDAPVVPWMRAIEADGALAGFVMLAMATEANPEPHLWRFLVDRMHQRRGIGARALELVIEQCRTWGHPTMLVSWIPGRGTPAPMYLTRGFEPTGVVDDGEIEGRLRLGA